MDRQCSSQLSHLGRSTAELFRGSICACLAPPLLETVPQRSPLLLCWEIHCTHEFFFYLPSPPHWTILTTPFRKPFLPVTLSLVPLISALSICVVISCCSPFPTHRCSSRPCPLAARPSGGSPCSLRWLLHHSLAEDWPCHLIPTCSQLPVLYSAIHPRLEPDSSYTFPLFLTPFPSHSALFLDFISCHVSASCSLSSTWPVP